MNRPVTVVQYWAGCPHSANSKWQSFLAIAQRCQVQGWRSYLVWSQMPRNRDLAEPFRQAGCEIILQPHSRGNFDVASVWRTYRLLRHLNCSVFHCHNDHTSPLLGAFLSRVPVRIWSKLAMSSYYEQGTSARGLHRLMLSTRISCWCAHCVLAISNQVRQELADSVAFSERIETVPMPVDAGRFAEASVGEVRRELGLSRSQVLVTAVGHAVPVKGWDIAIRALAQANLTCRDVHVAFVGSTGSPDERPYFQELTVLMHKHDLCHHIHFLGHRDDVAEILRASDIFVLPSRSEGMPAALIEAMAAGLPCVAARVGGVPDVISPGEDGLLFDRENADELAGHLVRLVRSPSLRSEIAGRASQRARDFSMQAYVDRVFLCYETLLHIRLANGKRRGAN